MASPERRERRRVGALLNAYYRIEGIEGNESEVPGGREDDLDRQGFDAKQYFDNVVASGQLPELVRRKESIDSEVKELDADMQTLVYENYSKFIRATDVIKQMKFTIEGLEPDLQCLEGNLTRITRHQQRVEDGISGRAQQVEGLLKQQRLCQKLQVLFGLPASLQRCLDQHEYGRAVESYCRCATFLQQYRHLPTFQNVLEGVEEQMSRIRSALEERLRSPELSVEEAVNSAVTLLHLRNEQQKVAAEYLTGRKAVLRLSLDQCFALDVVDGPAVQDGSGGAPGGQSEEAEGPESAALRSACSRAAEQFVPQLCSAAEGFQRIQDGGAAVGLDSVTDEVLSAFVSEQVEQLCQRISSLVDRGCPPTRALVTYINLVRDALRRLHSMLPRLLTKLFMAFLSRTVGNAMKALFSSAATSLVAELCKLHAECNRLQESKNSALDDVLEEIAKAEQALIMYSFTALTDCQPLLGLVQSDRSACQQLVRELHSQLISLFLAFVEACHAYVGHEATEAHNVDASLPVVTRVALAEIDGVAGLEWNGLFGLALVRIGRHLEVKAMNKVWAVAKDLFTSGDSSSSELMPHPAVIKATRGGAQAVISHYVLMSGQRLAHFFRNSVQSRNWMTVREPRDPRLVVDMVLKEVHAFDAQLSRLLGDPRKARNDQRRTLSQQKTSMELEMDRLWAKKLQVFAPIPFNRNGAVAGILRIAFKGLYEYMREETFAKFGLQQMQVDCAFLAEVARDFVEPEEANVLDSLLDEVLTSASQRCVEPVLMDSVIVETLCDEKKKSFKFE